MVPPGVNFRVLTNVGAGNLTSSEFDDINSLLSQLGKKPIVITRHQLIEAVEHSQIIVARCSIVGRPSIIGLACFAVMYTLTNRAGFITHFVVDKSKGHDDIATAMMGRLINEARELAVQRLNLIGRFRLETAQDSLQRYGFVQREATSWRLELTGLGITTPN